METEEKKTVITAPEKLKDTIIKTAGLVEEAAVVVAFDTIETASEIGKKVEKTADTVKKSTEQEIEKVAEYASLDDLKKDIKEYIDKVKKEADEIKESYEKATNTSTNKYGAYFIHAVEIVLLGIIAAKLFL